MEHIGIDLGARHCHVSILDRAGKPVGQMRVRTPELPSWLARREASSVVMEACTQSPVIARAALDAGHKATIVPGSLVRAIGIGMRGIKTDERDAQALSQASHRIPDLPGVHLRSAGSSARRDLFNSRQLLVDARKSIGTNVKSWLRGRLQSVRGRAMSKHFSKAVRELALEHAEGLPIAIDVLLTTFDQLTEQITRLNEELEQLVENDPVCRLLMTVPGVGPVVSMAYQAQLDDPHRFASADHVGSYLALVPGEATTGGKVVRTSVVRAGPKRLKALLVQAAWSMWRSRPNDPLVLWARAKAKTRGKRIAIVALARKLSTILWSMWKHNKPYDPQRASTYRALPDTHSA